MLLLENSNMSIHEYCLRIPKAYSRGEVDRRDYDYETVEKVPSYELYIEPQIGSVRNRRDTYVYLKLPESGRLVSIILYKDGGVNFDKQFHKYVLREMDELDRRIVLGFCKKNEAMLRQACYENNEQSRMWLQGEAMRYKSTMQPKRLKLGKTGSNLVYGDLEPYEERTSSIFENVHFII